MPDLRLMTGTLSTYIVSSKGFNPVADVSPLYLYINSNILANTTVVNIMHIVSHKHRPIDRLQDIKSLNTLYVEQGGQCSSLEACRAPRHSCL